MNDARAQMLFGDPPYNVRIASVQLRGRIKHPEFAFASGEMSEQEYVAFLKEALGNAAQVSVEGAVHYVCVDWRHIAELIIAGRSTYGAMLNLCVWTKTNPGQGSFYRSQHELIGVFRVGRLGHQNNVELGRFGRWHSTPFCCNAQIPRRLEVHRTCQENRERVDPTLMTPNLTKADRKSRTAARP
jgi:hypothetical protein